MITIATQCTDRKAMVQKLAAALNLNPEYQGMPSCAYQIGEITVNRDASVSGEPEHLLPVAECLKANGYIAEIPTELIPEPDTPVKEMPAEETTEQPASLTDEITTTCLRIYEPNWTIPTMTNLIHMIYARQTLINRMLQMNSLRIDDELIDIISRASLHSVSDLETLLHDAIRDGLVEGFNIEGGAVMVELPYDENSIRWVRYSQLITACNKAAKEAKRVLPRRLDSEADKYYANAWLNRLGFGGSAHKELRHELMAHLNGYAAFKSDDRMQAHKDKQAALRRAQREAREAEQHDRMDGK